MNREEFLRQLAAQASPAKGTAVASRTAEQFAVDICRALNGPDCCPPRFVEARERRAARR